MDPEVFNSDANLFVDCIRYSMMAENNTSESIFHDAIELNLILMLDENYNLNIRALALLADYVELGVPMSSQGVSN